MFGTRSRGKVYNFVHTDEIWKDHVIRELQSQKKWTEQWGYLFEEYQKLQEGLLNIGSALENEVQNKVALDLEQTDLDSLLKLQECDEVIPLVESEGVTDCRVEKLNLSTRLASLQDNARGKSDILKLLKWPQEGMI